METTKGHLPGGTYRLAEAFDRHGTLAVISDDAGMPMIARNTFDAPPDSLGALDVVIDDPTDSEILEVRKRAAESSG